jgi:RNA polymerase sigma-70 factor (ECF subfamily)
MSTTSPSSEPRDTDSLLEHAGFVRGLARALVCDAAVADDVAQETLLAAIEARAASGRFHGSSLRAWLTGVVKNLVRQLHRGETRRLRRERDTRPRDVEPAAAEAVARLDLIEHLVAAVRALDEPYRTVVLARFFEGRSANEIALAQGVPLETVRTRLKRAIERLRGALDHSATEDSRERRDWVALLLPFTGLPAEVAAHATAALAAPTVGAVVATAKAKTLLAAAIVALLASGAWMWHIHATPRPRHVHSDVRVADASALMAPLAAATTTVQRQPESTNGTAPEDPLATFVVRGKLLLGTTSKPWPRGAVRAQVWPGYEIAGPPALEAVVTSDDSGEFVWRLRPPQETAWIRLAAEIPHARGSSAEQLLVPGDPAPEDLALSVYPFDRRVFGHVRDVRGEPIADAQITAYGLPPIDCDEAGAFETEIATTARGDALVATAPGFAASRVEVRADTDEDPIVQDFVLGPGASLIGTVTDEQGRPLAGVVVQEHSRYEETATTSAEGRFRLEHLKPDVDQNADAFRADRVRVSKKLTLVPGENRCDFVLPRGVPVSGVVLMPDGAPARGTRLCLGFITAIAREHGEFALPAVPPGEHRLVAERRGCAAFEQAVRVEAGAESVNGLVLRLVAPHFLAGRVTDEDDQPIEGALVSLRSGNEDIGETPRTDADGHFRVDGLPDRPLDLWIDCGGYLRSIVNAVEIDRADARFELVRAGCAAGRVVDGETGAPISRFRIRFLGPINPRGSYADYSWYERGHPFHAEDGRFDTGDEQIEPGTELDLEVTGEGYAPTIERKVEFAVDSDPDDLVIRLYHGATVEGVVLDEHDRHPIADASVKLVTDATPIEDHGRPLATPRPTATTDANGHFRLESLPRGVARLLVDDSEHAAAWTAPFEIPSSGAAPRQEILAAAAAAIEGLVLDGRGAPLVNPWIMIDRIGCDGHRESRSTTTDAAGRFRVERLPAGRWQVCVTSPSKGEWPQPFARWVELNPGDHASFTMPPGSAVVSGRLLCDGKLPESVKVEATRFDPATFGERMIEVMVDGKAVRGRGSAPEMVDRVQIFATSDTYELAGLDDGRWTVTAQAFERASGTRWSAKTEITVEGGAATMLDLQLAATTR